MEVKMEEKICERCNGHKIAKVLSKSPDGYSVFINDVEYINPVANNMFDGEYLEFSVCLDCGLVQGDFPIQIDSDPFVPQPLQPETHVDPETFFRDCFNHDCGSDNLLSADNPMMLRLGYVCKKCGWRADMSIRKFKGGDWGEFSHLKEKIMTMEGRNSIFKDGNNG